MTVCIGGHIPIGYGAAMTVGHVVLIPGVNQNTGKPQTPTDIWGHDYGAGMEHEANHARQWDVLGPATFIINYGLGYGVDRALNIPNKTEGCYNPLEWSAGWTGGNYNC